MVVVVEVVVEVVVLVVVEVVVEVVVLVVVEVVVVEVVVLVVVEVVVVEAVVLVVVEVVFCFWTGHHAIGQLVFFCFKFSGENQFCDFAQNIMFDLNDRTIICYHMDLRCSCCKSSFSIIP